MQEFHYAKRQAKGAPVSLIYTFFGSKRKNPYFSLSFAFSEYKRRTLVRQRVRQVVRAPVRIAPLSRKQYLQFNTVY